MKSTSVAKITQSVPCVFSPTGFHDVTVHIRQKQTFSARYPRRPHQYISLVEYECHESRGLLHGLAQLQSFGDNKNALQSCYDRVQAIRQYIAPNNAVSQLNISDDWGYLSEPLVGLRRSAQYTNEHRYSYHTQDRLGGPAGTVARFAQYLSKYVRGVTNGALYVTSLCTPLGVEVLLAHENTRVTPPSRVTARYVKGRWFLYSNWKDRIYNTFRANGHCRVCAKSHNSKVPAAHITNMTKALKLAFAVSSREGRKLFDEKGAAAFKRSPRNWPDCVTIVSPELGP